MNTDLLVTYTGPDADAAQPWLHLEQEPISPWNGGVTPADLTAMVLSAMSGRSATDYQRHRCPGAKVSATGTITVTLGLYVWPSDLALAYTLTAKSCEIGPRRSIRKPREVDLAFADTDTALLPYLLDQGQVAWETGCYDSWSEPLLGVAVSISGATVTTSKPCYGIARTRGEALGYYYPLTVRFIKHETGADGEYAWHRINSVALSVTATWLGTDGQPLSQVLEIELPECVRQLLELCPDGTPKVVGSFGPNPEGKILRVYFDACRGDVLRTRMINADD